MLLTRLGNNNGFVKFSLLLVLASIGAWYGYRAFKSGSLSSDLSSMLVDCQRITGQVAMSPADKAILDQTYATIATIAAKYKIVPPPAIITP